jgi:hypothetical protein
MTPGFGPGLVIPDLWQQETVRALQQGKDVVVQAPTGSGKTYIFELLYPNLKTQAVFTVPTRALAPTLVALPSTSLVPSLHSRTRFSVPLIASKLSQAQRLPYNSNASIMHRKPLMIDRTCRGELATCRTWHFKHRSRRSSARPRICFSGNRRQLSPLLR